MPTRVWPSLAFAPHAAARKCIEYPVALDADGKVVGAYAVNSYPDYYIIGSDGKLRWGDIANADVEKAIEHLLAEK